MTKPDGKMKDNFGRRYYLAAVSAAGASLAGCLGDDSSDGDNDGDSDGDSDGDDLGERVPAQPMEVIGGAALDTQWEQASAEIVALLGELGVDSSVTVKDATTFWAETYDDNRSHNYHIDNETPSPSSSDPNNIFQAYTLDRAGANGLDNINQYANCEFDELVAAQATAPDEAERNDYIQQALEVASQDVERISLFTGENTGAYRSDQIDAQNLGLMGTNYHNIEFIINSSSTVDDLMISSIPGGLDDPNFLTSIIPVPWKLLYAGLMRWDENFEVKNSLASSYEVQDDFNRVVFEIREEATFHDGEPVTAEDAKWTFNFIEDNVDAFPVASEQNYESIEVINEKTVAFNFEQPNPTFITGFVPEWPVLHSELWIEMGAEDNPGDFNDEEKIGAGPYQISNYEQGEILHLEPYEDHWNTPGGEFAFQTFQDSSAEQLAFEEGRIDIITITGEGTNQYLQENVDGAEVWRGQSIGGTELHGQHSFGTSRFREFRLALSHALDRELILEIIAQGNGEPRLHSCMLTPVHPYYPEDHEGLREIAESTTGDLERARQILEDNGWGWDDDGNLHYPPGAETESWPEGSEPLEHPDQFPCVDELYE